MALIIALLFIVSFGFVFIVLWFLYKLGAMITESTDSVVTRITDKVQVKKRNGN